MCTSFSQMGNEMHRIKTNDDCGGGGTDDYDDDDDDEIHTKLTA